MAIIPLAVMKRLIKSAGADRVSDLAASALGELLEDYGVAVSQKAMKLARHAKRKTVTLKDIKLAGKT
jgi:histone H3/H4